MIKTCPSCGSPYIGGFRMGTQQVEDLVKKRFPQARVLRMDLDTTKNKDGHEKILSAFANEEADSETIINYTADDIVVGGKTVTTANHTARIAGLIEGTPLHQSVTFATLSDIDSIENLTKEEADRRIDAGELILVREMGKVRVARGVNSLTTLTDIKGNAFQKIKLRKILNLIHNDLRRVIVEKYIGKVPNNYDNKCVLITEIKNYLDELATEQLIEKVNTVGIDLSAQKKWLKDNTNLDVNAMTEQEIKEANTQSNVFLAISLKTLDAMEDIVIGISI